MARARSKAVKKKQNQNLAQFARDCKARQWLAANAESDGGNDVPAVDMEAGVSDPQQVSLTIHLWECETCEVRKGEGGGAVVTSTPTNVALTQLPQPQSSTPLVL